MPSLKFHPQVGAALAALGLVACAGSGGALDPAASEFIAREAVAATQELAPDASRYASHNLEWRDAARSRAVPARLYLPAGDAGPSPLVVVSHGIGGSREGYKYLGRYLAANGIAALHLQHTGSDRQLWFGNPLGLLGRLSGAAQQSEALMRAMDVRFALDELLTGPWASRIDASRIAIAGHSYGANTAMLVAGARVERDGREMALRDARIRAAILISAPPFYGLANAPGIVGAIAVPTLHITATDDDIVIPGYRSGLSDRLEVFAAMGLQNGARKVLAVFKGGSHSMFTDRLATGGTELNPVVKTATRELALGFLKAEFGAVAPVFESWRMRHAPLIAQFEVRAGSGEPGTGLHAGH